MSELIKIKVDRFNSEYEPQNITLEYEVPANTTLLKALEYIKTRLDNTLTFQSSCRSEICGSCAMRVNGKETLACRYKIKDGDIISPLRNSKIIKDLVVDSKENFQKLKTSHAFLEKYQKTDTIPKDQKQFALQSDCILCNSCYSACPVLMVNENFIGPFALTRVYRYSVDKCESDKTNKLENIQKSGIWDCTLCGECAFVCPQNIQPNMDIMMLRNLSTQNGYQNPMMQNMANFGTDFGGFNPNF
jgi:fumarate reductase iron-sulfur subunit